ncbi:DUF2218 domain-containing protein [Demequina globuliformis]|uniref:DUF2218 domain-containing protein n=1 Tax=Demequina globuliformis TaxID=676202 RepID=UPI000780FA96|nr:DUF2218 domain-containing protein [Demequina globuliformis]
MTLSITGRFTTDRPARYLKQLCSHLSQKIEATHDEGSGTVVFQSATSTLTVLPGSLEVAITGAADEDVYRSMGIVGGHLEKFAAKEGLAMTWDDAAIAAAFEAKREEIAAARRAEVAEERAATAHAS